MTHDDEVDAIAGDVSMAADLAWAGVQAEHAHASDQIALQLRPTRLGGSRTLVTDITTDAGAGAGTLRAWLVSTLTTTRAPLIGDLGDFPYGPDTTRDEARKAAHQAGRDLLDRLRTLTSEQLGAFAEQDTGTSHHALVTRILDTWHLPRLSGVSWVFTSTQTRVVDVPKRFTGHDGPLRVGDRVMLAGDTFWDRAGVITDETNDAWLVTLDED